MSIAKLFEGLYPGARRFAHTAMEAYTKGDQEVFLLHAGISIERLAKAVLAQRSPLLLMELKGSEDVLFQFAGLEEPHRVRTIGAAAAIKRCQRLDLLPTVRDDPAIELIELRNQVAHLVLQDDDSFDALAVFARTTNSLLSSSGLSELRHWDKWADMIELTLNNALEKAVRDFQRKVAAARYHLEGRFAGMPSSSLDAFVMAMSFTWPRVYTATREIHMPQECPACSNLGRAIFGRILLVKRDQPAQSRPEGFSCQVCGLMLWTLEELEAANMADLVPLVTEEGAHLLSKAQEFTWHADLNDLPAAPPVLEVDVVE
ncbi:hypothetical protein JK361_10160 [Streptomyces sp. 5-8]|uniref:Uncharacterized protein n=1 Tax=Streptomyces musisoli TaxID=2802280 RepID=A0ABS1NY11_9ACTN|nr:hypothetical protein [Streptomyces musisoli]MBL1104953.1 hypothetical protein [Streptomyces musisoli]